MQSTQETEPEINRYVVLAAVVENKYAHQPQLLCDDGTMLIRVHSPIDWDISRRSACEQYESFSIDQLGCTRSRIRSMEITPRSNFPDSRS